MPPLPLIDDLLRIVHNCAKQKNLAHALCLHALMHPTGLDSHPSVGKHLVLMWAEVESMENAQKTFDRLVQSNNSSWDALLTGYIRCEKPCLALTLYRKNLYDDSLHLSRSTIVTLLKACTQLKDFETGVYLHAEVARQGRQGQDEFVGSALIIMYAKCGSLAIAQSVFDMLEARDVVSWTAIIKACMEHECNEEALDLFDQMQREGVCPDAFTYTCGLKACGSLGTAGIGQEIHAKIAKQGFEKVVLVGNALVDMYAKCGLLLEGQDVLEKLSLRNRVSWTALIAGYAEHGPGEEAIKCFEKMQCEVISADAITFACSLKACGTVGAIDKGRRMHAQIAEEGLERHLLVGSSLVDMYAKCGWVVEAQEVFNNLLVRNTISWTALIAGYLEFGLGQEALNCLELMQRENVLPDALTYVCAFKACGSLRSTSKGRELHAEIARKGLEGDLLVGNTLVDMYAKCGVLTDAQDVFVKLSARDLVSWNSQIAGNVEHGHWQEALDFFEKMQQEKVLPNDITFVCCLKACGVVGAEGFGERIHMQVAREGLDGHPFVGNALIDMYTKCGSLAEAQVVFDKLLMHDDVSWNALITGYAQLGESMRVFHIFDEMLKDDKEPNLVTFMALLNTCSHAGLVDRGWMYFKALEEYSLTPTLEVHICMVDLLGRAGLIEEAVTMTKRMAHLPDAVVWHTILGACQKGGNVDLGRQAFAHAVLLNESDTAAYVTMCNIHTTIKSNSR